MTSGAAKMADERVLDERRRMCVAQRRARVARDWREHTRVRCAERLVRVASSQGAARRDRGARGKKADEGARRAETHVRRAKTSARRERLERTLECVGRRLVRAASS